VKFRITCVNLAVGYDVVVAANESGILKTPFERGGTKRPQSAVVDRRRYAPGAT
jgi:hypothetical protein